MIEPDEQDLIEQTLRGDKDSFAMLVRHYQNRIFAFVMRMTANRDAALDLTQDTFLAAYQNLGGFRRESSFSTWLFQIAANRTKNYLKKAGREIALPEGIEPGSDRYRPDHSFEREEKERLIKEALVTLPYKQRLAFTMRYYEQMKFDDIARIQGISVSAAKTSFAEALKKLKNRLSRI